MLRVSASPTRAPGRIRRQHDRPTAGSALGVVVFDHASWEGPGKNGLIPPIPTCLRSGAHSLRRRSGNAGTFGRHRGAPSGTNDCRLQRALVHAATDKLEPPRSARKAKPQPVATAPFYAAPLCAGITYTMGGITVDEHARALDADAKPLPGSMSLARRPEASKADRRWATSAAGQVRRNRVARSRAHRCSAGSVLNAGARRPWGALCIAETMSASGGRARRGRGAHGAPMEDPEVRTPWKRNRSQLNSVQKYPRARIAPAKPPSHEVVSRRAMASRVLRAACDQGR